MLHDFKTPASCHRNRAAAIPPASDISAVKSSIKKDIGHGLPRLMPAETVGYGAIKQEDG